MVTGLGLDSGGRGSWDGFKPDRTNNALGVHRGPDCDSDHLSTLQPVPVAHCAVCVVTIVVVWKGKEVFSVFGGLEMEV